jgi:hypothetical protein
MEGEAVQGTVCGLAVSEWKADVLQATFEKLCSIRTLQQ